MTDLFIQKVKVILKDICAVFVFVYNVLLCPYENVLF